MYLNMESPHTKSSLKKHLSRYAVVVKFCECRDADLKLLTDMVIQVTILFGLVLIVKTQIVYFILCVHIHGKNCCI